MKWTDDAASWKGPSTFPALQGADNGTDIACLTPSSTYGTPTVTNPNTSRCYFQAKGAVREVVYQGGNWTIVGNVPIS
jgi:hypothetical protein